MTPNAAREWGIWFTGGVYTVGHFLKTLGPASKVMRFSTRQAAQLIILDGEIGNRYVARMIPNSKPTPEKN